VAVWTATRLSLLVQCGAHADRRPAVLAATLAAGLLLDLMAALLLVLPLVLYLAAVPERVFRARWHRGAVAVASTSLTGLLLLAAAAEWFFWEEFGARFNFIAVDYLLYTREVLGNIWESYPVAWVLAGIAVAAVAAVAGLRSLSWYGSWTAGRTPRRQRAIWALPATAAGIGVAYAAWHGLAWGFANRCNRELSGNGLLSLVAAFRANELNYEEYYSTLAGDAALRRARQLTGGVGDAQSCGSDGGIARPVRGRGEEKRWNVIQITVESLSGSYLGVFGNRNAMTPVLDRLADESLFFTRCFATGTRTVRGMEALTLSVPPTPGCSLVRRPGNEGLFSLGALFRDRGYDTRFIYSGFGYFDNMNYFFAHNGFDVIDRAAGHEAPVTFANVWGACDGDLYTWVIEAADQAWEAGRPFYHFVMTTSNHRPYTFPPGTVDLPQGHRKSAVAYTDYALGRFLEAARAKPWFANTLVVVVADHCASSAGETDLPIGKYHIPLLVYNPALVPARRVDTLCSQIDVAPTVLGLLGWSYESRFYGHDILTTPAAEGRALVSTYQALGYLKDETLTVLDPGRSAKAFRCDLRSFAMEATTVPPGLRDDAIAYYQSASILLRQGLLRHEPPPCVHTARY
jgi:phosphoglycerol transferase MdoB-like AlkP superfamily enzyme